MNCSLECNIHEYTPFCVVLVEVRSPSSHPLDFGHKLVVRSNRLSPCQVRFQLWNSPEFFWTIGCNKFPCHFFLVIAPWFRFRNSHDSLFLSVVAGFSATSAINPPRMHLAAFLENSTLRLVFELLISLASGFPEILSITGLLDSIGSFANEKLTETVEDRFITVGFLILPQLFLLLFVVASSSPSFRSS